MRILITATPSAATSRNVEACYSGSHDDINGLVQERHNSIANALELCLSWPNPSIWSNIFSAANVGALTFRPVSKSINICLYFPSTDNLLAGHMIVSQVTWSHTCCCSIYSLIRLLDSFAVSLHSPAGRHLAVVRAVQEDSYICLWKIVGIPTGHVSLQSIATEAIPTDI